MRISSAILVAIATAAIAVEAGHVNGLASRHHNALLSRQEKSDDKTTQRRCQVRKGNKSAEQKKPSSSNEDNQKPAETHRNPQSHGGTINVHSNCGNPGATSETTKTTGPNGSLDWLNCGVESGGWHPPQVRVEDLIFKDLDSALNDPNTPFRPCRQFVHLFNRYGGEFGLPPILLASFAMQESSCRPDTVGGGGEQGLMQITREKCGGAPGGNCRDPEFNVRTAARYFANVLKDNGGNVLRSVGTYNGWAPGMTVASATRARHSGCCTCQNNLDYLHQFMNGWLQNLDARDQRRPLGRYFNLNVCY